MANAVEMLSGRRKKDYAAESAADELAAQAEALGIAATETESDAHDEPAEQETDLVAA